MTAQEIINIFEEAGVEVEDFAYGDYCVPEDFEPSEEVKRNLQLQGEAKERWIKAKEESDYYSSNKNPTYTKKEVDKLFDEFLDIPSQTEAIKNEWLESVGIGPMVEVEQVGGEDQGSLWYSVKHFPKHDVYIMTTGQYSSYHGTDFYDGYGEEVFPAQVTSTVYVTKKPE